MFYRKFYVGVVENFKREVLLCLDFVVFLLTSFMKNHRWGFGVGRKLVKSEIMLRMKI